MSHVFLVITKTLYNANGYLIWSRWCHNSPVNRFARFADRLMQLRAYYIMFSSYDYKLRIENGWNVCICKEEVSVIYITPQFIVSVQIFIKY